MSLMLPVVMNVVVLIQLMNYIYIIVVCESHPFCLKMLLFWLNYLNITLLGELGITYSTQVMVSSWLKKHLVAWV